MADKNENKPKTEITSQELNASIFAEIKKLENRIAELKTGLKPITLRANLSLAQCNAMTAKHRVSKVKA